MMTAVSVSVLRASSNVLFGPAALLLMNQNAVMVFLISALDGISKLMGSSVSAGDMSGGISEAGQFNNSLMYSVHLSSCFQVVVSGSLSLTGFVVQVLQIPLSCSIFVLADQFLNIVFLVPLDVLLYIPVSCCILLLCFYLSCLCLAYVQYSFFVCPLLY
jgi:hypothetical protein